MKKNLTILLFIFTLSVTAQGPTVEGTYLPVKGTSVKQVWDTTNFSMSIPTSGPNQIWDYTTANGQFTHIVNTFQIKTFDAATTPYHQYFPTATHATYLRTPFNNPSDSLYTFLIIDRVGVHNLGGFSLKKAYDSTSISSRSELLLPALANYTTTALDTSRTISFAKNVSGFSLKIKSLKYKSMIASGYGLLKMPSGNYNNVLLAKETIQTNDSIFVDFANTGSYTYYTRQLSTYIAYAFIRNNTFGSSYLMHLTANATNTMVDFGWYSLPVDFGSISGSVFTNTLETTPVTNAEAYLYRENSNFAKNDILSTSNVDATGHYNFDSIPYGQYRVAIRPNVLAYPNSKTTYFGDTTNWIDATPITTTTLTSAGHNIHLQYHATPTGSGLISGQLGLNNSIMRTTQTNPIPGIGIVIKKNPGGGAIRAAITGTNGAFSVGSLDNGSYDLFVDIPGLYMAGTYSFVISGGTTLSNLDFTVGSYSIHPNSSLVAVNNIAALPSANVISAYPNPYTSNTTISLNLTENTSVLLEVYNMLGEKIVTLDDSQKQMGIHTYNFNAKSFNNSAGVYLIKVRTGDKISVLKIIEQ